MGATPESVLEIGRVRLLRVTCQSRPRDSFLHLVPAWGRSFGKEENALCGGGKAMMRVLLRRESRMHESGVWATDARIHGDRCFRHRSKARLPDQCPQRLLRGDEPLRHSPH